MKINSSVSDHWDGIGDYILPPPVLSGLPYAGSSLFPGRALDAVIIAQTRHGSHD